MTESPYETSPSPRSRRDSGSYQESQAAEPVDKHSYSRSARKRTPSPDEDHQDRSANRKQRYESPEAETEPNNVIGIFGLDRRADEQDLYGLFSVFGTIDDIQIVYDGVTKESRGFAFVYYANIDDAIKAVDMCKTGQKILGREVRVDFSRTTKPHKPTPGVYMGERRFDRHSRPPYQPRYEHRPEGRGRDDHYEPPRNRFNDFRGGRPGRGTPYYRRPYGGRGGDFGGGGRDYHQRRDDFPRRRPYEDQPRNRGDFYAPSSSDRERKPDRPSYNSYRERSPPRVNNHGYRERS